jgi:hypothetical protein
MKVGLLAAPAQARRNVGTIWIRCIKAWRRPRADHDPLGHRRQTVLFETSTSVWRHSGGFHAIEGARICRFSSAAHDR